MRSAETVAYRPRSPAIPAHVPVVTAPPTTLVGLRQYVVLVGVGAFATTFAQSRVLASLPTTFLLKNQFHLSQQDVAFFFFWVTFPWTIKPLVGILTDAFPLFGTRRRHYMILGSAAATITWAVMGISSSAYIPLLAATLAMNVATIFPSTVMGGLMVEAGQTFGASGRMSSLRHIVQSFAGVIAPVAGGYLAARSYGWTGAVGAVTALGLAVCAYVVLRERRVAPFPVAVTAAATARVSRRLPASMIVLVAGMTTVATVLLVATELGKVAISLYALAAVLVVLMGLSAAPTTNPVILRAQSQLGQIFESRTLWCAVAMILFVYIVPGLNTALVYQQSDTLKFSTAFIGLLGSLENVFGVAAAACYVVFCRRLNLRTLLLGGVGIHGLATLLFLIYSAETAVYVHVTVGFVSVLTELAIMDLAIRSTPAGCEALAFAMMMSVRNFGIAMSDVIGSQLISDYHISFNALVLVNAATTIAVLTFVPVLPRLVLSQREGAKQMREPKGRGLGRPLTGG